MNQNMVQFAQVRESVRSQAQNFHDEVVPLGEVSFNSLDVMRIGGTEYRLRQLAGQSMATRLGIPYQYLNRCDADIQAMNLNYWVEKQKANASDMFVRFDGNEIRGTFSKKYIPIDNTQIVDELTSLGFEDDADVQWYMDDKFMMLSLPDPSKRFALLKKNKDEMIPGVSIGNSEVGLASFSVAAYMLRLICTNGLISKQNIAKTSYRHVSTKVLEQLPTILESATSNLDLLTNSLREATKAKVENPEEKLIELNDYYALGEHLREAVQWAWPQEKGGSMFNIIQTYTRAVQFEALSSTQDRFRLQEIAGNLLQ